MILPAPHLVDSLVHHFMVMTFDSEGAVLRVDWCGLELRVLFSNLRFRSC